MPNLQILLLNQNELGCTGIKLLTKMNIPCLQKLQLGNCGVENEGVKHLAKGCWPNLQTLYLCQNLIEFDGHRAISEANWSKMGLLFIYQYLLKAGCATKPIYIFALINCQINIKSIQIKKSRHRQFENDFKAILKRMHK